MSDFKEAESGAEILAADDLQIEFVDVPEWKLRVRVRALDGMSRDTWESSIAKVSDDGKTRVVDTENIRAKLVARCIVGKDGARLFTDAQIEALGKKSGAALSRIFDVASRLNALSEKDVKDLAKNSDAGQSGGST